MEPSRQIRIVEEDNWRAGVAALPLVVLFLWLFWRWWARRSLENRLLAFWANQGKVSLPMANDFPLATPWSSRMLAGLRRGEERTTRLLDVDRSIHKTVQNAGMLSPVWQVEERVPHTLLLVEAVSNRDPLLEMALRLANRLAERSMPLEVYRFAGHPRQIQPLHLSGKAVDQPVTLSWLAQNKGHGRLLVISEGQCLLSAESGQPFSWLAWFAHWPQRFLLTPRPICRWGRGEQLLAASGFHLLQADNQGLHLLLQRLVSPPPSALAEDSSHGTPFPPLLRVASERYTAHRPPPDGEVKRLLGELLTYLTEEGLLWLRSLAVFPAIHPHLTWHLGHLLQVGQEGLFLRLANLPWCRQGWMPDWLRLELLRGLDRGQEKRIRQAIHHLLHHAQPGHHTSLPLEMVTTSWLDRARAFWSRPNRNSNQRKQFTLTLNFQSGRLSPLALAIPATLAHRWFTPSHAYLPPSLLAMAVALLFWFLPPLNAPSTLQPLPVGDISQPWQSPILRLESGMHGAMINRIAVDEQGRYLVTASHDKTARIWRLSDGHLLHTLRPPIGQTPEEGKLFAAAISPDGSTVAVAGWTGVEWNMSASIYLFDRATGKLRRSLTKLPNVINHLAWSKDGGTLAAILAGKNGVRMYSVADGREVGKDESYGDSSFWADFDDQGRLVTSSDDYFLRLYDPSWELVAKVKTSGKQPFGVAFSPGGHLVAVGYYDSSQVDILDGSTLNLLYAADTTGVTNSLNSISWSPDGRWLYAGGRHDKNREFPIRRWADQGKGEFQDFPVSQNSIMGVRPLSDGRMVFGAGDPRWGVMDQKGQIFPQQGPQYADFRRNPLHLSQDGGQVAFSFDFQGERPARFSLATSRLESPLQADHTLNPPRQQADGLEIKDWQHTFNPTLNGKKLKLVKYERSRSLAIAPDGNHFLLGNDWSLRLYNRQGEEQWQNGVPGATWQVNISGDGRLAVAAFGDGTIRWYRVSDGKELLAFFPHSDGKRWVAWTPAGYYKASADGESLLGWHVNQGLDKEALFYPVSHFRDIYHRPDVVDRVLTALDVNEALRLADAGKLERGPNLAAPASKPPQVDILTPRDGSYFVKQEVVVNYRADTPLTALKVTLDGQSFAHHKVMDSQGNQTIRLTLPARDVTLGLMGENSQGTSRPSTIRLQWRGMHQPSTPK
ncbi:MAG: hypothetical protein G8345_20105 [Magnetococcales bacterium]|nr:hypothetical protein [Magnetococcales bacterium]